jgi:hypothetical protein
MTDKPTWDRDVAHVADYGIDLVTAKGTTGITWAAYGNFGYGLQLSRSPLLTRLTRAEFCSAAGEQPRDAALGQPITEAGVCWLDVTWGEQETTGPVALILRFAAGASIVIACGSWSGPQEPLFPTGDDIVVLWQPATLPVLAPFLQDGPPGPGPFPEQAPAQRSEPASGTGPSAMPAAGSHYLCYPARPPDGRQRQV